MDLQECGGGYMGLLSLFMAALLMFQAGAFTFLFVLVLVPLLLIPFFKEVSRLFIWSMLAYFFGLFLILYADRIVNFITSPGTALILNRLLFFVPVLFMIYVGRRFSKRTIVSFGKPECMQNKKTSFASLLMISLFILMAIYSMAASNLEAALLLIVYIIVNSVSEELLWRGAWLTRMTEIGGPHLAVFFSAAGYGASFLMLGFSASACLGFAIVGIFYGLLVMKTKNLLVPIVLHMLVDSCLIASGLISVPLI